MERRRLLGLIGGAAALLFAVRTQQPKRPRRIALVHSGIAADKLTEKDGPFWARRFHEELRQSLGLVIPPALLDFASEVIE